MQKIIVYVVTNLLVSVFLWLLWSVVNCQYSCWIYVCILFDVVIICSGTVEGISCFLVVNCKLYKELIVLCQTKLGLPTHLDIFPQKLGSVKVSESTLDIYVCAKGNILKFTCAWDFDVWSLQSECLQYYLIWCFIIYSAWVSWMK